jgi:CheY-like chemotaxis protein
MLPIAGGIPQSDQRGGDRTCVETYQPPSGTLLVVEDEEVLRFAIAKMLRKSGFQVIEAIDGSSAIELLRTHADRIDLMLLDVTLPGISSREVVEQAHLARPNLRVILTSAYGREAVDAAFDGLQIDRFIRKPFQIANLLSLLQEVLSS